MAGNSAPPDNQSEQLSIPAICQDLEIEDLRFVPDHLIKQWYFYTSSERLVILVFYPILFLFGLIGNLTFLLIVVKIPSMQTFTNIYLANLAVADILFILTSTYNIFCGFLISPTIKTWPYFSSAGCTTVTGGIYLSLYSSTFLILLVSTERYLAICRALKHRLMASKERTTKLVIQAWIAGTLCTLPVAPHFGKLTKKCVLWPDTEDYSGAQMVLGSCVPAGPFFEYIPFVLEPIPFVVCFSIISVLYYHIIKKLQARSQGNLAAESASFDQSATKARNRVAVLLIVTAAVYFLCILPYYTTRLNDGILAMTDQRVGYKLNTAQHGIILQTVMGLGVINSIINPVIYSITNPRYRKAFIDVFTCGFRNEH